MTVEGSVNGRSKRKLGMENTLDQGGIQLTRPIILSLSGEVCSASKTDHLPEPKACS